MINLCLVVIATQFAETKRRETERMIQERKRLRSSGSLCELFLSLDISYLATLVGDKCQGLSAVKMLVKRRVSSCDEKFAFVFSNIEMFPSKNE